MITQKEINQLWTIQKVAKKVKRSIRTIERWIEQGKLPAIHCPHNILINPLDIPTYLRKK